MSYHFPIENVACKWLPGFSFCVFSGHNSSAFLSKEYIRLKFRFSIWPSNEWSGFANKFIPTLHSVHCPRYIAIVFKITRVLHLEQDFTHSIGFRLFWIWNSRHTDSPQCLCQSVQCHSLVTDSVQDQWLTVTHVTDLWLSSHWRSQQTEQCQLNYMTIYHFYSVLGVYRFGHSPGLVTCGYQSINHIQLRD